jgi:hypothetical protein
MKTNRFNGTAVATLLMLWLMALPAFSQLTPPPSVAAAGQPARDVETRRERRAEADDDKREARKSRRDQRQQNRQRLRKRR